MNEQITSFDAVKPGVFGDIVNIQRKPPDAIGVGLLSAGYFEY